MLVGDRNSEDLAEGRVLLFTLDSQETKIAVKQIEGGLRSSTVTAVSSLDDYEQCLQAHDFDVVILDWDLPQLQSLEHVAKLRLRDIEPQILLLSECKDPYVIKLISDSKRRYIVRDDRWLESTIVAIKDMLRIQRLEHEMTAIRARLTEANSLLDQKNRRLDEFCQTVAHDIRGPLAGLMLKIEYIADSYEDQLDVRCIDLLKRCLKSSDRLTDVVQSMYEFAKLGSKAAKMEEVDLKQLVLDVLSDLPTDESREVQVGVGTLPCVWGNSALLRRVFINLVGNAIKYNDKSTPIVNVGCSGIVEKTLAPYAEVFIEDNGPGIPKGDHRRIFSMFNRGPQGSKEGLGVGLAVVERIVELHYGEISVVSDAGQGARFSMWLPTQKVDLIT